MEINDLIEKLVETVRVGKSVQFGEALHSIGFCKDIHSARVQFDKHIKTMEALDKVKKIDRGVWSTKDYRGNFLEHDQAVTETEIELIKTRLPLTIRREVSFPLGLRADIVGLIGKNNKGTAFWLEVCDTETDAYFNQKATALKNNRPVIIKALTEFFSTNIPDFTLVVYGKQHPEAMNFEKFIEEVQK